MLAAQRHHRILEAVHRTGGARVAELAARLRVTPETIRRDLDALVADGRLVRSHGGALPLPDPAREPPHGERARLNAAEKDAIGREAAARVRPGDTVILDASSSALFMARHLPDQDQTVVTNALLVARALAGHARTRVVVAGGTLFKPSLSFLGPAAEVALRGYRATRLFLSARGVDVAGGLTDANEQQAALKRVMIAQAAQRIVMADGSKFGIRAPDPVCGWEEFEELITDAGAPRAPLAALERAGLKVTRVQVRRRE